ncbi:Protein kinase-like domain containing protein [Elaphomyces granulatus]
MKPLRIQNKYQLDLRLGGGSFGEVYQGHDLETGEEVALKLELGGRFNSPLCNEIEVYKALSGGPGIPQLYWDGYECQFTVMAFELLGPTLEDLLNYCGRKFSLKTVLLLTDQLISRFQYLHSKGYIHRDVKPDNLLMGDGKQGARVYVSDLGLAKRIDDWDRTKPLLGTVLFASISAHVGKEQQTPCDDMESLGYVLLYFLRGYLPWEGLKAESEEQVEKLVLEKKQLPEDCGLFKNLPVEFKKYFEHLRSVEMPDYSYLRRLFRNLFRRNGFESDSVFDWTELKFLEELERRKKAG